MPMHSLKWIVVGFATTPWSAREPQLSQFIARYLQAGDVVFTTWRNDGNPDHGSGQAALPVKACDLVVRGYMKLPIWAWHWPAR